MYIFSEKSWKDIHEKKLGFYVRFVSKSVCWSVSQVITGLFLLFLMYLSIFQSFIDYFFIKTNSKFFSSKKIFFFKIFFFKKNFFQIFFFNFVNEWKKDGANVEPIKKDGADWERMKKISTISIYPQYWPIHIIELSIVSFFRWFELEAPNFYQKFS